MVVGLGRVVVVVRRVVVVVGLVVVVVLLVVEGGRYSWEGVVLRVVYRVVVVVGLVVVTRCGTVKLFSGRSYTYPQDPSGLRWDGGH